MSPQKVSMTVDGGRDPQQLSFTSLVIPCVTLGVIRGAWASSSAHGHLLPSLHLEDGDDHISIS